jgi:hypothetical protein
MAKRRVHRKTAVKLPKAVKPPKAANSNKPLPIDLGLLQHNYDNANKLFKIAARALEKATKNYEAAKKIVDESHDALQAGSRAILNR